MNQQLVITEQNQIIYSALFSGKDLVQINVTGKEKENQIGTIYVGRVANIVKNINAAFIEIGEGVMCYYSIKNNPSPIFCKKQGKKPLCIGDELLVQIAKEGTRLKEAVVTSCLNLTGKYLVLTHGKCSIGVSGKITDAAERSRLRYIMEPYRNEDYGFIIRTNAKNVSEELLRDEQKRLTALYQKLRTEDIHKTAFTQVHRCPPSYICDIRDGYSENIEKIVTDSPEIYSEICEMLKVISWEDEKKFCLYEDTELSLSRLYGIETKLEKALAERVWLNSGGFLVIQPTEALTVVDVNTGKAVKGSRDTEETFFRLNMEAAKEIARQLRLRNLSGIIIIDFIDMEEEAHRTELLESLRRYVSFDPIKTTVVDITALNLVEVTRRKIRRPLFEQVREASAAK
ncbi:ribonuclease E/G [Anaerolentibacter hominis]|uniref:ribonuclease E/G n=1 Tax=Anaerolentibacter hominis TaxID=3079009 RepID=UPI0031B8AB9F